MQFERFWPTFKRLVYVVLRSCGILPGREPPAGCRDHDRFWPREATWSDMVRQIGFQSLLNEKLPTSQATLPGEFRNRGGKRTQTLSGNP